MITKLIRYLTLMTIGAAALVGGGAWALDEAVLTPTNDKKFAAEEQEFNSAMDIWFKHRYADGEKMLKEFSKKNPNGRWKAEADLHIGCYETYLGKYDEAKKTFKSILTENNNSDIKIKATIRLGAIAESEAKYDEAISYFSGVLGMNPTWDQFKYANSRARILSMTRGKQEARIKCGPIALAACLEALGKSEPAEKARNITPDSEGVSLAYLQEEAKQSGLSVQAVEMTLDELKSASLPVLAYVNPKHFVAILGVDADKLQVEDSIRGRYEVSFEELGLSWSGRTLVFDPDDGMKKLSLVASIETVGGCCGQVQENECLGGACDCQQTATGPGGGGGCGGGDLNWGDVYKPGCVDELAGFASAGRPTWQVNMGNLNILVRDTPIFYNPGKGPKVGFTLTYSNENSNTGIFGRGWRSPFDMKAFYLPDIVLASTATSQAVSTSIPANGGALSVASTVNFPASGAIMLKAGASSEVITYSSKTATSLQGITRGPVPINAASGSGVDLHTPTLQIHRDSGRIETYEWSMTKGCYVPRQGFANYGYRDSVAYQGGQLVMSLKSGGKYRFMPEGSLAEGRTQVLEDAVGNRVVCGYNSSGCLVTVTDAAGGVTNIVTEGTGINERVRFIKVPKFENGQWVQNAREAELRYTDGNLTYIKDMLGDVSTLSYSAFVATHSVKTELAKAITASDPANGGTLWVASTKRLLPSGQVTIDSGETISYTGLTSTTLTGITRGTPAYGAYVGAWVNQSIPDAHLSADITASAPADGGQLNVDSTDGFPEQGQLILEGNSGNESVYYIGKTATAFTGITRGNPAYGAAANAVIRLAMQAPYLSEIVTPSKRTQFTYQWIGNPTTGQFVGLHEVRECGPSESYPQTATVRYDWDGSAYETTETRYGDLTKLYNFGRFYDAITYIVDEENNEILRYGYNDYRDRTSVTNASGNTTNYTYLDDTHVLWTRRDQIGNEWSYTYNNDGLLHTETDPYGNVAKTYTYNSAGQVVKLVTPLGVQVENFYYTNDTTYQNNLTLAETDHVVYTSDTTIKGFLAASKDARGKTTNYHYNENGETRGFLTSVHDPENKATLYQYDTNGRKSQVTDPSSSVTRYFYDDLDRVTKTIFGQNDTDPFTETKYTCCHKVYEQDENGRRTYYLYDAKVRPYKVITSALSTTLAAEITWDAPAPDAPNNNIWLSLASVAGLPPTGKLVVLDELISYDLVDAQTNRVRVSGRGVDGTRRVNPPDPANPSQWLNEVGDGDPVGLVGTVLVTNGYHPQYLDRMISLTDANEHTTYYTYYKNGKKETIWYPDNTGERYFYDNNNKSGNNLKTKQYGTFSGTYPNQVFTPNDALTLNYEYDANGQLLRSYH